MKRATICLAAWSLALPLHGGASTIGPSLEQALSASGPDQPLPVILRFAERVDPASISAGSSAQRREELVRALIAQAERSRALIRRDLDQAGAREVRSIWLINGLSLAVPAQAVGTLARLPGVESIDLDSALSVGATMQGSAAPAEWNLELIGAGALWQQGHAGEGVVVASLDTGVDAQHIDIGGKWRGGSNSWFDPNGEHAVPNDVHGHGTQTMGLMVGGDAGGTAIGVAPGAQWIAAKIFNDAGVATYSGIHLAYQWILDPDGNWSTDDAPDVVVNPWGLVDAAGSCVSEFQVDIDVLRAAGISVSYSAGNAGPAIASSVSPANYPGNLSVGAVDEQSSVAPFSSRGPSACDGALFPAVVAPGVDVRTAALTFGGLFPDAYLDVTGTSFAAAHVAGGMALLKSVAPQATAQAIEAALRETSLDLGTPGGDNDSGHGLIDLVAAAQWLDQSGTPGVLSLSADSYSVAEDGGELHVGVVRSEGSSGAASIEYFSTDGTALAGVDYAAVGGVVHFSSGETSQSIVVPLIDDALVEPDEMFTLSLTNPVGATLGWPASAVVTITDDDVAVADADGDGYAFDIDCNDQDASIHPGAEEVKRDGVDQDCNGYDLTIEISKAEYDSRKKKLTVQASSALGANAGLQVAGFGAMKWNKGSGIWTFSASVGSGAPEIVVVSGIEGSEQQSTVWR